MAILASFVESREKFFILQIPFLVVARKAVVKGTSGHAVVLRMMVPLRLSPLLLRRYYWWATIEGTRIAT